MDFTTYLVYAITFAIVGEGLNCRYPRIDEYYDSEGMMCSWEEDDFYLINGEYILTPEDSTDNRFEAKARKRYWENK